MKRLAFLGILILAACDRGVPLPRLPQVEQASELVQGGRLRSHQTCSRGNPTVTALIDCMAGFHYEFIARGETYPAAECWRLRDARGSELPPPACFLRMRSAPEP